MLLPIDGPFLNIKTLLDLNLANCNLTTISPRFFTGVINLNTLDLSDNALNTIQPGILDPLMSLKHLFLNNCNLTYIPYDTFTKLRSILTLHLGENNFKKQSEWTIALNHLDNLEYLNIRKSGVSKLNEDIFFNNTLLRSLVLAENELSDTDIISTLGKNIANLHFLDLSYCKLNGHLFETALVDATELHTLILTGNRLISEYLNKALSPLKKLVKLSIKDCGLTMFPVNSVHNFTHLKELDISTNSLDSTHLYPTKSLEHLDMSYNNIEKFSKTTFSKMSKLKTLILSGNKLKNLEKSVFKNLKGLKVLELNDCGLEKLHNTIFYEDVQYPNLVELRLSGNPIKTLHKGSILPFTMSNLNILDMSNCNLNYLTKEYFIPSPNLNKLLLNNNLLQSDGNHMRYMEHLTNIEYLDLAYNNMTLITPQKFSYNYKLVSLNLVGNRWNCDCSIVDMWNWVSATTLILRGYVKSVNRQSWKILYCKFNLNNLPINRSKLENILSYEFLIYDYDINISWRNYVKDSNCSTPEEKAKSISVRIAREVHGSQSNTSEADNEVRKKLVYIISICVIMLIVSIIMITVLITNKRRAIILKYGNDITCDLEQFIVH